MVSAVPGLWRRLAATGHADVAAAIFSGPPSWVKSGWWPLRAYREVLAAASPQWGWTKPDGPLKTLRMSMPRQRRASVVCPLEGVARTMLVVPGYGLTRAEQLRGLVTVHDHDGGAEGLRQLDRDKLRPEVVEILGSGDIAALRAAMDVAEGTAGLIEEFQEFEGLGHGLDVYLDMLGLRDDIDWDAVRDAHAERLFGKNALLALATRADCPADLRPPAPEAAPTGDDQKLRALVAEHLGDDVEAWRTVRARLARFSGDLAELVAEVGTSGKSASSKAKKAAAKWPGAGEMPAWDRVASVTGARARFLTLLDAAPDETHLKLLKHLDDRTVSDLFGQGEWRDAWLDFALGARPKRYRLALAQRPSLTEEAIEALMGRGDPDVNARLCLRNGATGPQRERLLAGRLTKELVERLLGRQGGFRARDAIGCSDARLQRHIMEMVRVRGNIPQLRLLLNLWERGGPAAVSALLDEKLQGRNFSRNVIRSDVRRSAARLLAQPDADAALAELRAKVVAGETAEAQIERLREHGTHPGAEVFREAHLWHWDELIAEHRREPFSPVVMLGLIEVPECPQWIRDEAERVRWRWVEANPSVIQGETPEEVLGGRQAGPWLPRAVRAGALTWEDAITLGHPAAHVLAAMTTPEARAVLGPLVREHLDPDPGAWHLALRMIPGFTGTVTELLQTAVLATSH
ncbi:hypothetical protein [Actinomadura rupiterrae]|uniref:hypothetical protein n=1 Tax=Actinomadura rupiterrae TaxID=559627 RepID=UPI0020A23CB4|nr:hypothetical protein [Actinomadura rupiterrae]MCP2342383.1 hypothetical protein [Actinomadura rupiterrae]